jgi:hypothetical protein
MGAHRSERQVDRRTLGIAAFVVTICVAWGVLPGSALAASAPAIAWTNAWNLTPNDATVGAEINPEGLPHGVYYQFQVVANTSEYLPEIACSENEIEPLEVDGCMGSRVPRAGDRTAEQHNFNPVRCRPAQRPGQQRTARLLGRLLVLIHAGRGSFRRSGREAGRAEAAVERAEAREGAESVREDEVQEAAGELREAGSWAVRRDGQEGEQQAAALTGWPPIAVHTPGLRVAFSAAGGCKA